jgi:hypothetical protein
VTTTGFSALARFTAKAAGAENLSTAEYAGPLGMHDAEQIRRNVESGLIERIVNALTTADADSPQKSGRELGDEPTAVCSGTADEIERFFRTRQWTDGLPIVPPTLERIEAFVRDAARSAQDRIAILSPANLWATTWNIAVNAVMAGCEPGHMPILIAAVEAMADERASMNNIGSSSGIIPYLLVNGPLARELGIAGGAAAVSHSANRTIGRALGLVIKNIAGFREGVSYMGTFGYPLPFVIAELDNENPWEPFHVSCGFSRESSTVTFGVTNNWGASPAPYETSDQSGAKTALDLICREVTKKTRLFNFPAIGPEAEKVMVTVLMSPPVAKSLAAAGFAKKDVNRYVYENARMRLADFDWVLKYTATMRTTSRERAQAGVYPAEFAGAPDTLVRVLSSPEIVHIAVCGDPHRNRIMVMEGGHTEPVTREIARSPGQPMNRNRAYK